MKKPTIFIFVLLGSFYSVISQVQVQNLRCEMLVNPVGIDVVNPRLSWEITSNVRDVQQKSFQVLVASSPENLASNKGDIWNSGKTASTQSVHIAYAGDPLKSGMRCFWKVKVWTNKGESEWGQPASWSMGLLDSADWKARWIGLDRPSQWDSMVMHSRLSARYIRKEFQAKGVIKQATVYICGLGMYELYINGQRIGDQVLSPSPTDYTQSVLYNTFDVTKALTAGKNAVGAILGNGRYFNMRQNFKPHKIKTFGFPKMLLQMEIEYTNGARETIVSDTTWKINADGPIRSNNEFDGEEYDATKEFPGWTNKLFYDKNWPFAELVKKPEGKLVAQMNKNMKVMETIKPVAVTQIQKDIYVLDLGQNMAGWVKMQVTGKRGTRITLRYSERIDKDGRLYTANLRSARSTDVYTLKGGGLLESFEPSFVYHGFRYVELTGFPGTPAVKDFTGQVVYDEMATTGSFECSNPVINKVYKNAYWTIRSNYKGMPVDCPQRDERQPWLGDRAVGSLGESFVFDNARLYDKWLDDMQQSQKSDGQLPDMSPPFYMTYYSDNMTWPGTYILITDMLYRQFGDIAIVQKHYASMARWLGYMNKKYAIDGLMTKDKYGDWCVPPESPELIHSNDTNRMTNGVLIATAYNFHMLQIMQHFAKVINKPGDEKMYAEMSAAAKDAFNKKFLDIKTLEYGNNTVTANLLPLYFGMVPDSARDEVFNNIAEKIVREQHGYISTGLIGSQWLMRGLTANGRPDIAYTLATNTGFPSWGYMTENGATTIWELWNGNTANPQMNSHNHVMLLGDLLAWYYEDLAGIKSDPKQPGFKHIIMKPSKIDGLQQAKASYQSLHGLIRSEWQNDINRFAWKLTIPGNTSATVYIPANSEAEVSEGGTKASETPGVKFVKMEGKTAVYEVSSGTYYFVSTYPMKSGIMKDAFIFDRASFPESHAATIAETGKGLVTAWFGGTKEGKPDVDIWVSCCVNEKWAAPVDVANGVQNDTLRYPCWNPVLYQIPNGDLLLFYKIGPKVAKWKGMLMTSSDAGQTWSKPTPLPEGFLGPVKNKPVLLKTGELLCPSSTEGDGWKVHFEMTPDNGKTWTKTDSINDGKTVNAIQPSILSYKDGKLQVLCRSKNAAIVESWSYDNGKTWSPMVATSMPNNNSGTDAVTLADGRQLLVYNHVKTPDGEKKGPRTPLNVAVSDDGKTWSAALVLEDSPISQYSYPSVIQTKDGLVHIVYTWRRERIKHVVVDPEKLKLVKIENGLWPGTK